MRRRLLAIALGVVLMGVLLATVVTDSKPRLAASNSKVTASGLALTVGPGEERCQGGEFFPRQTRTLRLYPEADGRPVGEPLVVSMLDAKGRVVSRAAVPAGYTPSTLDIPVTPPARDVAPATFCLRNAGQLPMSFAGNLTPLNAQIPIGPNGPGARPTDEIRVDYYRMGHESWLELAPVVARRFYLFKPSFFGPWTMWATLAVMALAWGLVIVMLLRSPCEVTPYAPGSGEAASERKASRLGALGRGLGALRRWLPAAGWACVGLAFVHGAVWATVTPPLQVPDEPAHVGYAQYLAEEGRPPPRARGSTGEWRQRADATGDDLSGEYQALYVNLPFGAETKPSWSKARDRQLRRQLEEGLSKSAIGGARGANAYPPLYYAVEAVPARLGSFLHVLDRLYLMRLVSALIGACTVAFVFLFLRELLPATPWAWTVGALAVAFQPLFAFMSGGVNNDNLLYTAGSALLFLLARSFRWGLTPRIGLGIGVALMAGLLTKPGMLALVPGAALGVALAARRSSARHQALLGAAAAAGTVLVVGAAFVVLNGVVWDRATLVAGDLASTAADRTSLRGQVSYLWQYFLPQLPFMAEQFRAYPSYPVWEIYVQGFVGRFGYFQYGFHPTVNRVALAVFAGVGGLATIALVRGRVVLRKRWPELACYGLLLAGVVVLNAVVGYRARALSGSNFEQPRYLFPVLALYGAVVAMAARGAGRRWGPAVGAFLVVLAMGHSLFAILLTIARYYA